MVAAKGFGKGARSGKCNDGKNTLGINGVAVNMPLGIAE
jgi:hypothetical protein